MLLHVVAPAVLLSMCVVAHALAMTALLRHLTRSARPRVLRIAAGMWILIRVALTMLSVHLLEIGIWASFFTWQNLFPDFRTSFYFSAVTYTTTGYGDLVLPDPSRMLAAVEALTGILMCGWSTGILFAVVSRMYFAQVADTTGSGGAAQG